MSEQEKSQQDKASVGALYSAFWKIILERGEIAADAKSGQRRAAIDTDIILPAVCFLISDVIAALPEAARVAYIDKVQNTIRGSVEDLLENGPEIGMTVVGHDGGGVKQ